MSALCWKNSGFDGLQTEESLCVGSYSSDRSALGLHSLLKVMVGKGLPSPSLRVKRKNKAKVNPNFIKHTFSRLQMTNYSAKILVVVFIISMLSRS